MAWRKPSNLRDWFRVVLRHKKKVAFPGMLVMIIAVVASFGLPRKYKAEARFQRVNDMALSEMKNSTISNNLAMFRRSLREDLTSRDAVESLVDGLEMTRGLPHDRNGQLTRQGLIEKEDLIRKIRSAIGVGYEINADQLDQIVVSYTDTDPVIAPQIANRLVENYIVSTRASMDKRLLGARDFFLREMTKSSGRVFELEKKRLDYERDNPGLDPDSPNNLRLTLDDRRRELVEVTKEISRSQEQSLQLQQMLDGMDDFVETEKTGPNPKRELLDSRLQMLLEQLDHNLTVSGMTEEHPKVIKLRSRINELAKEVEALPEMVDQGIERTPNQGKLSIEQDIRTLEGTITALTERRDALDLEIQDLEIRDHNYFQVRNQYLKIEHELIDSAEQHKFWDTNLQRTQVALQTEVSQRGVKHRQIERAEDNPRPSSPTLMMILGLAGAMGLGTGFCCLIIAELMDHTFQSVEQAVDELKLPVLGAVNEIVTPAEGFRRRVLGWGVYPTLTMVLSIVLGCSLIVTYLSLQHPVQYEQFLADPAGYFQLMLFGGR